MEREPIDPTRIVTALLDFFSRLNVTKNTQLVIAMALYYTVARERVSIDGLKVTDRLRKWADEIEQSETLTEEEAESLLDEIRMFNEEINQREQ